MHTVGAVHNRLPHVWIWEMGGPGMTPDTIRTILFWEATAGGRLRAERDPLTRRRINSSQGYRGMRVGRRHD